MSELAFRPSLHGWPFENRFRFPPHLLGASRPLPDTFGLCGGMCWTALDRFLAGRPIPRTCPAPKAGEPLHAELILRQSNALARDVWNRIRDLQRMPARSHAPGVTSADAVMRREWRRLQDRLDAGEPALLCVVLDAGRYASPTTSHQVLAYGYDHDRESRHVRIRVYDPNHPGDDDRVLTLTLSRTGRPVHVALDGFGTIHGFFVVPYDRAVPPKLAVATFADPGRVTLNHPLLDSPTVLADDDGTLDLFGRDKDANLIRYRRDPDGAWTRQNLSLETGAGAEAAIHGRPMALGTGRGATVFARNADGDLLQFRQHVARGWRVHNLTDNRKIGPDYRLAGDPVPIAGPGRRTGVFGVTSDGRLVHYEWAAMRGWSVAEPAAGTPSPEAFAVNGRPVPVIGPDDSLHVLARGSEGRLLHFRRNTADATWIAADLLDHAATVDDSALAAVRIAGDPTVLAGETALDAFARTTEGGLIHGRWTPTGGWSVSAIALADPSTDNERARIASDPMAIEADEALHVFARNAAGGLVHVRQTADDRWMLEDVTHSRATLDPGLSLTDGPVACATHGIILVAARQGRRLVLYTWRADADWTAEWPDERGAAFAPCSDLERLVALADERGHSHLFATDALGTVVHLECAPTDRHAPTRMEELDRGRERDEARVSARDAVRSATGVADISAPPPAAQALGASLAAAESGTSAGEEETSTVPSSASPPVSPVAEPASSDVEDDLEHALPALPALPEPAEPLAGTMPAPPAAEAEAIAPAEAPPTGDPADPTAPFTPAAQTTGETPEVPEDAPVSLDISMPPRAAPPRGPRKSPAVPTPLDLPKLVDSPAASADTEASLAPMIDTTITPRVPAAAPRSRPRPTRPNPLDGLPLLDDPEDDTLGPQDLPVLEPAEENTVARGDRVGPVDPDD